MGRTWWVVWLIAAGSADGAQLDRLQQLRAAASDFSRTGESTEAALYAELQTWRGVALKASERQLIAELQQSPVRATLPHPEGLGVRQPQYPIAQLAQALLRADDARLGSERSRAQLGDTAAWLQGLRSSDDVGSWIAPLEQLGPALPADLRAGLADCASREARCANALLAVGPALTAAEFGRSKALAAADAQLRLLQQLDPRVPGQHAILQIAATEPATRGLATQLLARSAGDERLALLADPDRGAEVAAVLSTQLDRELLAQLSARFAASQSTLEQQRLLLVLQLSSSSAARTAREQWLASANVLPQTRLAVQSW